MAGLLSEAQKRYLSLLTDEYQSNTELCNAVGEVGKPEHFINELKQIADIEVLNTKTHGDPIYWVKKTVSTTANTYSGQVNGVLISGSVDGNITINGNEIKGNTQHGTAPKQKKLWDYVWSGVKWVGSYVAKLFMD